jgi:PAS domain S-box-containing protein
MQEIIKINLENEMDLVVAHKRAMKLAELTGLTLPVQTIFATAVSEIARCAIDAGKRAYLVLGINTPKANRRELSAVIADPVEFCTEQSESYAYAKRLVDEVRLVKTPVENQVVLSHRITFGGPVTEPRIKALANYFENDVDLSPYEELRRKNLQLQELAARLHESEGRYRVLTDTLPLMMFSLDRTGSVLYTNKWFQDYLGFTVSHLPSSLEPLIIPEDFTEFCRIWDRSTAKRRPLQDQIRLRSRSGHYLWHLISLIPLSEEEGLSESYIGFLVDIHAQKLVEQTLKDNTELKATQFQLEHKINELNRSNDALEQFAYIASHDLQEPLRKIQTFADLLQNQPGDQNSPKPYLEKIMSSARRMGDLIRGVLDYSRLAQSDVPFVDTDLNQVVEAVTADFELLIAQKAAVVRVEALPNVPGIPLQLTQLFSNLLANALKFTEREPVIEISARRAGAKAVGNLASLDPRLQYTEITIRDNGIGFDAQYANQIFSIFRQLNNRQAYAGTGIGLALCKKIVENHHGAITASGEPGGGATFKVYLPLS